MTNELTNFVQVVNAEGVAIPVYIVSNNIDFQRYLAAFIEGFSYGLGVAGVLFAIAMVAKAFGPTRYGQD